MTFGTQHQADELFDPYPLPSADSAQQYFGEPKRFVKSRTIQIDTGLEEAPRIDLTSNSKRDPAILEPLRRVIDRLKELRNREPGWDSYSAKAIARSTIRPSLELALTALHKCAEPRLDATSAGGLIAIWEAEEHALEITVRPDGAYDLFLVTGAEEKEEVGATQGGAIAYLSRYCGR